MPGIGKKRILKSLNLEISRAKRFGYYVGVLLLDVAETTPRGIHKHLPGITVSVRHFRSLLRDYDIVVKTRLRRYSIILPHLSESESARLVRDRILSTSKIRDWGSVNVGIAIFPVHGKNSRELLKAAERDLQASLELKIEDENALQNA